MVQLEFLDQVDQVDQGDLQARSGQVDLKDRWDLVGLVDLDRLGLADREFLDLAAQLDI